MMKAITVLTATRAEYGLLSPIIRALKSVDEFEVRIVVTGAHLSQEYGLTYKEIEEDGYEIDRKIEMLLGSDTTVSISKSMGLAMISFADYFSERRPDALLVLGDRYETLAVCCVAMNERIPIIHLYGGETTEGAIDEAVRHAITKMSYLHLAGSEAYRRRVIQLGENPERVFTVGSIGVENALNMNLLNRRELGKQLQFSLDCPYAVVTFHPVTLNNNSTLEQVGELLKAIAEKSEMKYIITKANADSEGRKINYVIEEFAKQRKNVIVVSSLGSLRYLSALKYADMVIGNSSSGLAEAPAFGIPTINIGDRQKGRWKEKSVIDCEPTCENICRAIERAQSDDFKKICVQVAKSCSNEKTTSKVVSAIQKMMSEDIDLKKEFYDVDFDL